jgi:hypothetical protein
MTAPNIRRSSIDVEHKKWKGFKVASAHLTHDHRTKVEKVPGGRWSAFDRLHCLVHIVPESGGEAVRNALITGLELPNVSRKSG